MHLSDSEDQLVNLCVTRRVTLVTRINTVLFSCDTTENVQEKCLL